MTLEPYRQIDGPPHTVTIAKSEIVLTIEDDRADDGDWLPEMFVMTVSKHPRAWARRARASAPDTNPYVNDFTSSKFTVTIADDDPKPKFRFSSRNIKLAEENIQTVRVSVGVGPGGASPLPDEGTNGIETKLGTLSSEDGSNDVLAYRRTRGCRWKAH